jgi:hypothetical protein
MSDPLLNHGDAEEFKAAIHLGVFGLAIACLGYNAMAYGQRRQNHLLSNCVAYAGLAAFEVYQMNRHWRADHE